MMYKIDPLTMISGQDINVPELKLVIRQPKIREISMIGEKEFYKMCSFLLINKDLLIEQLSNYVPREQLEEEYKDINDYEALVIFINASPEIKLSMTQVLVLLFPDYEITIDEMGLIFASEVKPFTVVRSDNYEELRSYIRQVLCLNGNGDGEDEFNPGNEQAKAIADKIRKRRERLAKLKNAEEKEKSILSNYVSALSIGTNSYTLSEVVELTLYQLFDQVKRFGLWQSSDIALKAQLAGASGIEHVDWMGELQE